MYRMARKNLLDFCILEPRLDDDTQEILLSGDRHDDGENQSQVERKWETGLVLSGVPL
jgi:hypothetical protein